MQPGKRLYDGITESPSEYDKEDELMALKNLANWNLSPSAACGASCGASDKPAEEEKKPAACGAACGAADKPAEEQPAACGAADKPAEEKPAACRAACGASDK